MRGRKNLYLYPLIVFHCMANMACGAIIGVVLPSLHGGLDRPSAGAMESMAQFLAHQFFDLRQHLIFT
jgi:hypothetical protein